jgi:hypothetical protein
MHDIQHIAGTDSKTQARRENEVFNACRANEAREARGNVTFSNTLYSGGHEVYLRDEAGVVVLICKVDEYDV